MVNNDGLGAFDNGTIKLPADVLLFHDLDGDGDNDLISSNLEVHENLGPGNLECTDYPYAFFDFDSCGYSCATPTVDHEVGHSGEMAWQTDLSGDQTEFNRRYGNLGHALGLYHLRVLYEDDASGSAAANLKAADAGAITNAYVEWQVKCLLQPP